MAITTVPPGDERCDVCAGNRDRPKPRPGERASVRETVQTMCEDCLRDFEAEMHAELPDKRFRLGSRLLSVLRWGDPGKN